MKGKGEKERKKEKCGVIVVLSVEDTREWAREYAGGIVVVGVVAGFGLTRKNKGFGEEGWSVL